MFHMIDRRSFLLLFASCARRRVTWQVSVRKTTKAFLSTATGMVVGAASAARNVTFHAIVPIERATRTALSSTTALVLNKKRATMLQQMMRAISMITKKISFSSHLNQPRRFERRKKKNKQRQSKDEVGHDDRDKCMEKRPGSLVAPRKKRRVVNF